MICGHCKREIDTTRERYIGNGAITEYWHAVCAQESKSIEALAAATRWVEEHHPLPRCEHGNALRDHAGDVLEPSCGCREATP